MEWYYSFSVDKLFRKERGSWQTYGKTNDGNYRTRKNVGMPPDATAAIVEQVEMGTYRLVDTLPIPERVWEDVTSQSQVEQLTMKRNKRHLQQTAIEGGASSGPIMSELIADHGCSEAADRLIEGKYTTEHIVSEEMAGWLGRTDRVKNRPTLVGSMPKAQSQFMFKVANEKTSSSSQGCITQYGKPWP